jgi:hypothetical protein
MKGQVGPLLISAHRNEAEVSDWKAEEILLLTHENARKI